MKRIKIGVALVALVGMLGLAGCGDDDEGDLALYCERTAELDQQDGFPTKDQIDGIEDVAPEEIEEEIAFVADAFRDAIDEGNVQAVFQDEEVTSRFDEIEQFEDENCPGGDEGAEGGDEPIGGEAERAAEPAEGANLVAVTGTEYEFQLAAQTMPAGLTALELTNQGAEEHELSIGRIGEGHTLEEVLEFQGDPFAAGLVGAPFGNTGPIDPGQNVYLNIELEPGTYGMVCFIEAPDGTPHAFKGMAATFEVTG